MRRINLTGIDFFFSPTGYGYIFNIYLITFNQIILRLPSVVIYIILSIIYIMLSIIIHQVTIEIIFDVWTTVLNCQQTKGY